MNMDGDSRQVPWLVPSVLPGHHPFLLLTGKNPGLLRTQNTLTIPELLTLFAGKK
jgi:hypothetical protein